MSFPLLEKIRERSRWAGKDAFPSDISWSVEVERWLEFIVKHNQFDRFLPRLRDMPTKRGETFSEIVTAYYLEIKKGFKVIEWEPMGRQMRKGEFEILLSDGTTVFCEVKSPSWRADIAIENHESPRLKQEKYLAGQAGSFGSSWQIRHSITEKAYLQLPENRKTLVILSDDFMVGLHLDKHSVSEALYRKKKLPPYIDDEPEGIFSSENYKNLSAVATLNYESIYNQDIGTRLIRYYWSFFKNPNAIFQFDKDL